MRAVLDALDPLDVVCSETLHLLAARSAEESPRYRLNPNERDPLSVGRVLEPRRLNDNRSTFPHQLNPEPGHVTPLLVHILHFLRNENENWQGSSLKKGFSDSAHRASMRDVLQWFAY